MNNVLRVHEYKTRHKRIVSHPELNDLKIYVTSKRLEELKGLGWLLEHVVISRRRRAVNKTSDNPPWCSCLIHSKGIK